MKKPYTYQNTEANLDKFQLSLYFLPVVGVIPALGNLSNNQTNNKYKKISRLSVNLFCLWLLSYGILWLGSSTTPELISLRLMYLNALLTTGYFFTCLWLTLQIWIKKNRD